MNTKFYRDRDNKYCGKTELPMADKKVLQVRTYNYNGVLTTNASVMTAEDDGSMSCILFQDFNIMVMRNRIKRATTKLIEDQHNSVDFDDVLKQAVAFYA